MLLLGSASLQAQTVEVKINVNWPQWASENKVKLYDSQGALIESICVPSHCYTNLNSTLSYFALIEPMCVSHRDLVTT